MQIGKVRDKEVSESKPYDEASLAKLAGHIKTRDLGFSWDNSRRYLYCCLLGVRRKVGTNLSQALLRNVRSRHQMLSENTEP